MEFFFLPQVFVDFRTFDRIQPTGDGERGRIGRHVEPGHDQGQHRTGRFARDEGGGLEQRHPAGSVADPPAAARVHGPHSLGPAVLRRQTGPDDDAHARGNHRHVSAICCRKPEIESFFACSGR